MKKQLDGTLLEIFEQGSAPVQLLTSLAENQGVYLQSYRLLSRGAIITGLLWGSILAFLVDRDLRRATAFSLFATLLSLAGLIHAERIGPSLPPITGGYLILTALLAALHVISILKGKSQKPRVPGSSMTTERPPVSSAAFGDEQLPYGGVVRKRY